MKRLLILKAVLLITVYGQLGNADVGKIKNYKVKVAVIDTGIDPALMASNTFCDSGHKDFTNTSLKDNHGHGTHVSGLIDQYAKNFLFIRNGKIPKDVNDIDKINVNYCQIILKFYDPKAVGSDNLKNTIKAFEWAIANKVDIINYSGGGAEFSQAEHDVVVRALNAGIKVVAAAGNERSDIDKHKYYPAMYDKRIYIVGNLVDTNSRQIASSSNRGKSVNTWELGTNILSRLPNNSFGFMTGTSQATAVKSGKLVREMLLHH